MNYLVYLLLNLLLDFTGPGNTAYRSSRTGGLGNRNNMTFQSMDKRSGKIKRHIGKAKCKKFDDGEMGFITAGGVEVHCTEFTCPGYHGCEECCPFQFTKEPLPTSQPLAYPRDQGYNTSAGSSINKRGATLDSNAGLLVPVSFCVVLLILFIAGKGMGSVRS